MSTIIDKTMSIPGLYGFVQKTIAGPLHSRVAELLKSEIPDTQNNSILDVGCGLGNYSSLFTKAKYIGFDLDATYIDHAQKLHAGPNASFLVGDAVSPPKFAERFTHAFSVGLYHHLSDEDTLTSLSRIFPLLTEGGFMYIVDAIYPRNFNIVGYVLRYMDRGKHVRTFGAYQKLLHANFGSIYISIIILLVF